jgi:hypothetical protein
LHPKVFTNLISMKTNHHFPILRSVTRVFLILLVAVPLNSCSQKVNFLTSSVVPAARGYVKIKKDNNKNYNIYLQLSNLAESQRLLPPKQAYVIWLVNEQGVAKNVGKLNSSTGMMSKKLKASFETVSSSKPTQVFITAEDTPSTQYPGPLVVISTEKF